MAQYCRAAKEYSEIISQYCEMAGQYYAAASQYCETTRFNDFFWH